MTTCIHECTGPQQVRLRYDCLCMLKIEAVKWHGKCSRHPMFDPEKDGISAVKGGCTRCQELLAICESYRRTQQMMRAFAPFPPKAKEATEPEPDRQQGLFDLQG
jgi:uncharacterized CHY-type Zn-finger protein